MALRQMANSQALVVTAFWFGKYMGNLEVHFDQKGNMVKYKGSPVLMDNTVKPGELLKWALTSCTTWNNFCGERMSRKKILLCAYERNVSCKLFVASFSALLFRAAS